MIDVDAPLLHIGYPKTATTWLQEQVFYRPEVAGFFNMLTMKEINPHIVRVNSLAFDPRNTLAALRPYWEERRQENLTSVLTSERLSGNPYTGGYDSADIARRLHLLFPKGRVLMVIREQCSMISSVYRAFIRDGGVGSVRRFMHHQGVSPYPLFRRDFYQYHWLIRHYQDLFGKERVRVMTFEHFCRDPHGFAREVCEFAGTAVAEEVAVKPVNEGLSSLAILMKRPWNRMIGQGDLSHRHGRFNRTLVKYLRNVDRLLPGACVVRNRLAACMKNAIQETVGDEYRESNREVMALTGLRLGELGYAC